MPPTLVQTPLGAIETDIIGPKAGSPVLVLHGTPGGIDAAESMSRFLLTTQERSKESDSAGIEDSPFRLILVSRPGFLNTPLDQRDLSIDHEADLLASLLETLHAQHVHVLAWSGGGPAAFRLAVRHPQRIASIIAIACVTGPINTDVPFFTRLVFLTKPGNSLLIWYSHKRPNRVVKVALENEGDIPKKDLASLYEHVLAHPTQKSLILEIARTMAAAPDGPRGPGTANDARNFRHMEDLELNKVTCPVLLIHGDSDTDVPPSHSREAAEKLKNCRLTEMDKGTHLAFYAHVEAEAMQDEARAWIIRHSKADESDS